MTDQEWNDLRTPQFAERTEFIRRAQTANSIEELEALARELPTLVENVSAHPAAKAVEERAQQIAPQPNGWAAHNGAVTGGDYLLPR